MRYYDHFVVPFTIGVVVLFTVLFYKYIRWFVKMPSGDKKLVAKGLFSFKTLSAFCEVVSESLLHRRIFRVNPVLGYMHMSLAFGWFLLIVFGWIEASMHLSGEFVPLYAHVFFKYFAPTGDYRTSAHVMGFIMDFLLLFVLSGIALAWFKRMRSRALGLRRTTKHTLGDKIALSALWLIFPVRLIAESSVSGIKGINSFLTGNIGAWMLDLIGFKALYVVSSVSWWVYSIVLAVFLVSLPFSRYMHIFTEIPLIFLRKYKIRSRQEQSTFDHFQIEACSRCGICIDPCQLQKDASINNVQSVYFLRDRRYNFLKEEIAFNCLMCGRCENRCPVSIELDTLRLNSRVKYGDVPAEGRYDYLTGVDTSCGVGKVGFFAGCMTSLSPNIERSMDAIFKKAGVDVWWADKDGGVCCGRPLKLSGEVTAAQKIMDFNRELFLKNDISLLVTPCPICLRVFKEDYGLQGIEVLHHSQYIERLMREGKITTTESDDAITYHDPCELGRGSGIYDEPRYVLASIGRYVEPAENRENALCCGSSLANLSITDNQQTDIGSAMTRSLLETGAQTIATACPLCKKAIARHAPYKVHDIAEIVARSLA